MSVAVAKSKNILDDDGKIVTIKGDMQFSYDHKFTISSNQPIISYIKLIGNNMDTVFTFRWSMYLPATDQWSSNVGPWNDYRLMVIFVPGMPPIVRHGNDSCLFDQMSYLDGTSLGPVKDIIVKYISDLKAEKAVFEDDVTKDTASARKRKPRSKIARPDGVVTDPKPVG